LLSCPPDWTDIIMAFREWEFIGDEQRYGNGNSYSSIPGMTFTNLKIFTTSELFTWVSDAISNWSLPRMTTQRPSRPLNGTVSTCLDDVFKVAL